MKKQYKQNPFNNDRITNNQSREDDWISVDEALPTIGETVLITYGYENLSEEEEPIYCAKRELCGNGLAYFWCSESASINEPKFWAFLPKSPTITLELGEGFDG